MIEDERKFLHALNNKLTIASGNLNFLESHSLTSEENKLKLIKINDALIAISELISKRRKYITETQQEVK